MSGAAWQGENLFDSVGKVRELFKGEVRRSRGTEQESTLEEGASGSAWLGCSRRKFRAGDESDYVDA